jgi:hypothetical protein
MAIYGAAKNVSARTWCLRASPLGSVSSALQTEGEPPSRSGCEAYLIGFFEPGSGRAASGGACLRVAGRLGRAALIFGYSPVTGFHSANATSGR